MTRLATAFIAATLALAALPAYAQTAAKYNSRIGYIISFNSPAVGCTSMADAQEADAVKVRFGQIATEAWAHRHGLLDNRCTIMGTPDDRQTKYKIMLEDDGYHEGVWYCVMPTVAKKEALFRECYWIFALRP